MVNKTGLMITTILLVIVCGSVFLNAGSATGYSNEKYSKKVLLTITPNEDLWELLFNSRPEAKLVVDDYTSATGPLCFPRGVPQSVAASGTKAVIKLYDSNGMTVDEVAFYNWKSNIGLPSGQGGFIGGILGGLFGGSQGGISGGALGAFAGYGLGSAIEENAFYGEAVFPCLSPGIYSTKAFIYDDDGDLWFKVNGDSFVVG